MNYENCFFKCVSTPVSSLFFLVRLQFHVCWTIWCRLTALSGESDAPTPVFPPGESQGRRAWWAAVHRVAKSQTPLSDFTLTFHFHALEKETATHSSVLAWRIPGTGEPGGLLSVGSHRVRHGWCNLAAAQILHALFSFLYCFFLFMLHFGHFLMLIFQNH